MRVAILFAGALLAAALGVGLFYGGSTPDVAWTAGVTLICAIWWIFEPIPIPANFSDTARCLAAGWRVDALPGR